MGPAAYSRNGFDLWENTLLHNEYETLLTSSRRPIGKGLTMTPRVRLERDVAMGLCLLSVNIPDLEAATGLTLRETFAQQISELTGEGLLEETGEQLRLTEDGVRYATHVMKCFTS